MIKNYIEEDIGFENDIFRRAVVTAVKEDNPEILLQHLKDFLCKIPYPNAADTPEWYYQNLLYAILATCGLNVQTEIRTSSGRIDFVVSIKPSPSILCPTQNLFSYLPIIPIFHHHPHIAMMLVPYLQKIDIGHFLGQK